jgi:hypothetical protein
VLNKNIRLNWYLLKKLNVNIKVLYRQEQYNYFQLIC